MFALSRTGMLRSYIESYEVADLLREVRRKCLCCGDIVVQSVNFRTRFSGHAML